MSKGFSLVELILALLIFQVGILGVVGMMILAQQSLGRAEVRVRGLLEAEWVADSLVRSGSSGPGFLPRPWGGLRWAPSTHGAGGLEIVAIDNRDDTLANVLVVPPFPDPVADSSSEGS